MSRAASRSHLKVVLDEGDSLQLGPVFRRYGSYVAAVALRLLGNETDVDDIVQEVFIDYARAARKMNDLEHARRWLVVVTVRKTRRLLRRRRVQSLFFAHKTERLDVSMPSAGADDRAALIQLFGLLARLPVNLRLAWSLRYLQDASLDEVAAACECSLATAKRWIAAAQQEMTGVGHEA